MRAADRLSKLDRFNVNAKSTWWHIHICENGYGVEVTGEIACIHGVWEF